MTAGAIACWACGSNATRPTDELAPWPFLACDACGLRFRPEQRPGEARDVYLTGDYAAEGHQAVYADDASLPQRRREARMRLAIATAGVPGAARLLDVGAAGGVFVDEARRAGWDAGGVEPDPAFRAYARDVVDIELEAGTIETACPEPRSLGLVTMWHVLEHVADPRPQLERLRDWLADDGRLVLEVPNAASANVRALGPASPYAQPEVHVGQLTPEALHALLTRAGFEVLDLWTAPHDAYYRPLARLAPGNLAYRLRWRRGGEQELLLARATPAGR